MPKPLSLPLACFLILFATLAIAGTGGMVVVSLRQKIARSAARLQDIENENIRLERLSEELRTKIAMLEHPEVLKRIAVKLGMRPANLDQYRLVVAPSASPRRNPVYKQPQNRPDVYATEY